MDDLIPYPLMQNPKGMLTTVPPIRVPPDYMTWIENYVLWDGVYRSRRGFVKYNRHAIPMSGLRFDGSTQYLEVPTANDSGVDTFQNGSSDSWVAEIAFIVESWPSTTNRMLLVSTGVSGSTEVLAHRWAIELYKDTNNIIQVRFRTGGDTMTTGFQQVQNSGQANEYSEGDGIRFGEGYRVVVVKDPVQSATTYRLLVFRDGVSTPISSSAATLANYVVQARLMFGKSLLDTLSSTDGFFKGIIQDFRFWKYADDTAPGVYADKDSIVAEDIICVRFDTELDSDDVADSQLKCYLKMDESSNADMRLADSSGEEHHAYKRPGPPSWVTPGLVANAPETSCVKLRIDDKQYIKVLDRPTSLGGSVLRDIGHNTSYEFGFSIAIELDTTDINLLADSSAAPDVIPLIYYGDDSSSGSTLGDDVSITGNWGVFLYLERVGASGTTDYAVRASLNGDTQGYKNLGVSDLSLVLGTKYRVDFIRSSGRYVWYRIFPDGSESFNTSGEGDWRRVPIDYTTPSNWDSEILDDTSGWSNGPVLLIGTANYAGTQKYFPGKIDDIRVFAADPEGLTAEYNTSLHPWDRLGAGHHSLVFYGMLNEGSGAYFTDSSTYNNNLETATSTVGEYQTLKPSSGQGTHGAGWVKPNRFLPNQGLVAYKDIETGTEVVFAIAGGCVWVASGNLGDDVVRFRPIVHGLQGDRPMSFAHVNNQLVMGDGLNDTLRYDGKSMTNLGIPAPSSAPGVVDAGGGNLLQPASGNYSWRYTWMNSKTGGRSNPSPATTNPTPAAWPAKFRIQFYVPDATTSPMDYNAVDTVEVWRTKAGGATYYKVGTQKIPKRDGAQQTSAPGGLVTPAFSDNVADASLGITVMTSMSAYGRMPKCRYYVSVKGRLVGLGQDRYPNRVVLSELHYPDHHDASKHVIDDIDSGDGDEITGAVYANDILYIFQRRNIWAASGVTDDKNIRLYHMFSGIGCVGHGTIQKLGGTIAWRGEENFYRLPPGATEPVKIGDPIRDLLELVDATVVKYETSAVLRQEGIYLCSVTTEEARVADSSIRNNYIFVADVNTGAWGLWTMNGLGYFANIELAEYSELFYLSRHGFVYRYSGKGKNADTAGVSQISYVDGLDRGKRVWFTLGAAVASGDKYLELRETDSSIDSSEDGMKGLTCRFRLDDGTWSSLHYIRKFLTTSSSTYRLYLTSEVSDDASMGNEVYVGAFDRSMITGEVTIDGNPFVEKTISNLAIAADANTEPPVPLVAPTVSAQTGGGISGAYGYTYEHNGTENRMSPITAVSDLTRAATTITVPAPDSDFDSDPYINVYLQERGTDVFKRILHTDASGYAPGELVTLTDPDSYIAGPVYYDPDTRNSVIQLTGYYRVRGGKLRTHVEMNADERDLNGWDEWRIPATMRGSSFKFQIDAPYPDTFHEIQQAALLIHPGEVYREQG